VLKAGTGFYLGHDVSYVSGPLKGISKLMDMDLPAEEGFSETGRL
jgi:hypothetical protein